MASTESTRHTTSGASADPSLPATKTSTTALLACGVVAGPLFIISVLAQALTRAGFDLQRHPLSSLSLGPLGWIQITTFVVTGLLVLAYAVATRRVLRPGRGGTWAPLLIGMNGASLIASGAFLADPINGYPPGMSEQATWHGIVHSLAPAIAGLAGLAMYAIFARRFAAMGRRGWATFCLVIAPIVVILNVAALPAADFRLTLAGLALSWAWTSLIAARLMVEARARTANRSLHPQAAL
ncbi:DUF998 domain-containing protein [Nonomuraea turkmeniaca]|uniref:DUF998 domain-containing protein n=1 Tax=Nonomuraea turkmeniaca TaxID=103838 RepID=A0A5S4FGN8_9ACTN|nr:DUF998 domain-containing protein [Nonomuraea turkmeniaca]TMR08141.1 DUF998 domain-containing protein [Nonomuraea turkmeniaca]